jgi:hypothetical protein
MKLAYHTPLIAIFTLPGHLFAEDDLASAERGLKGADNAWLTQSPAAATLPFRATLIMRLARARLDAGWDTQWKGN